jgi:hypothetical protein
MPNPSTVDAAETDAASVESLSVDRAEAVVFSDAAHAGVKLGGRLYPIHRRAIGAARAWRNTHAKPILDGVANAAAAFDAATSPTAKAELKDVTSAAAWVATMAFDAVFDAVCAWEPMIAEDRARIEESALDEEVAAAFGEVVKVAFPFGAMIAALTGKVAGTK